MKEPLVSLIIPFYNEENYLQKCIDSAINQTYLPLEIILVNDGSDDNSVSIAKRYSSRPNVHLMQTQNQGLGHARNIGIQKATGEFLIHLDADDWLDPRMVGKMVDHICQIKSDVALCKFRIEDEKGNIVQEGGWKLNQKTISGQEAARAIYTHQLTYTTWAKIYRRQVVKDIEFPEGVMFQDRPYLLQVFLQSSTVSFLDECLITILKRRNSISHRLIAPQRIKNLTDIYLLEIEILNQTNQRHFHKFINKHYLFTLKNAFQKLEQDEKEDSDLRKLRPLLLLEISSLIKSRRWTTFGIKEIYHLVNLFLPKVIGWRWGRKVFNWLYRS